MALILERRGSKDQILEMYLNDVYLGQRGSFAVHGVAEAARLFFGKDVSNVTLNEAATIAGIIQSPYTWSPFTSPERCRERRNVVLRAMADEGFISRGRGTADVERADSGRPARARGPGAVLRGLRRPGARSEQFPGVTQAAGPLSVYTTLDLHLQRLAQDAVSDGLTHVDELLSRRKRPRRAEAALIAIDPQDRRSPGAGRRPLLQPVAVQPGDQRAAPARVGLQAVRVSGRVRARRGRRPHRSHARHARGRHRLLVRDRPGGGVGAQQLRERVRRPGHACGAPSPSRATSPRSKSRRRPASIASPRCGAGSASERSAHAYPSITLGVFEATPLEIATAYTIFPNGGVIRPPHVLSRVVIGNDSRVPPTAPTKRIARADTTYLVTNMMRSVINEGTGAGARAAGFALDAAGKTGTTNDLRDAWFVGFTPELLTVVWVGLDDNQPVGLSGTQAALPIWAAFMIRALAGHDNVHFAEPPGIVASSEIDRDTGKLAGPTLPARLQGIVPLRHRADAGVRRPSVLTHRGTQESSHRGSRPVAQAPGRHVRRPL